MHSADKIIDTNYSSGWRIITNSKLMLVSCLALLLLMLIALLAPIIANDKPVYVKYQNQIFFPAFSGEEYFISEPDQNGLTKKIAFSELRFTSASHVSVIMPIIPFAPFKSDLINSDYKSPNSSQVRLLNGKEIALSGFNRHLLGTGKRGDDLLAGLIHGTRVSLTVGIISMTIAGFIGLLLGSIAGFFGDNQIKITRGKKFMLFVGLLPAWFYSFHLRKFVLSDALANSPFSFAGHLFLSLILFVAIVFIFYKSGFLLQRISYFKKLTYLKVDSIISRIIEVLISLPRIIVILTIAAIARPSLVNLILIIGLTLWTDIARLTRAEMLRIKNLDYIQSARTMGFKELRILFHHALPNAIAPAIIAITFGIASAILAESSLSFLGIGVPQDIATWGSLLAAGRENFQAWWLVVFPGLAIFITVTSFNIIGEKLRDAFDPKLKI